MSKRLSARVSLAALAVGAAALVAVLGLERALVPVAGVAVLRVLPVLPVLLVLLVIADEATSAPRRERARPRRGA